MTQPKYAAFDEKSSIALGHFISEVISASSEQMVYAILAQNLNLLIPNDRASVTLLNIEKNLLEIFSLHGCKGVLPVGKQLPLENTYTGWAVLQQVGQNHIIDSQTETLDGKKLYNEGMRCILNAPIIINGQSIGAINTATENPFGFNNKSLSLLELTARLVSKSLEHHKLLQERQQALDKYRSYASQLENLNQLAQQLSVVKSVSGIMQICEKTVQNIMPSQRVSYAQYLAEDNLFSVKVLSGEIKKDLQLFSASGTELERVLIKKQPVFSPDLSLHQNSEHKILYEMGMRSSMSIPIIVEGEVVGILSAASKKINTHNVNMIQMLDAMRAIISGAMERVKYNEKLNRQANYDMMTGLPNRHMFYNQLNGLLERSTTNPFSILFIDLDHFKDVNDSFGHHVGDELLSVVANRISKVARKEDLVARIGGDEFIVLITENCSSQLSGNTAERIIQSLSQPFELNGNFICICASIGISLSSDSIHCVDEMIKKADAAMYTAKLKGGGTYKISQTH